MQEERMVPLRETGMLSFLTGPRLSVLLQVKDYPYRVSMILRKGTWWIVERAHDMRLDKDNKTCFLEEEAEVLVFSVLAREGLLQGRESLRTLA